MQSSSAQSVLRVAGSLLKLIQSKPADESQSLLQVLAAKTERQPCSPEEQALTQEIFAELQESLLAGSQSYQKVPSQNKADRGFIDGCYDLCHSGHFNAIRQAAATVHTLVIGPNSDEEILAAKGPTVLNGDERAQILQAVKWGDEVTPNTPYEVTESVLDQVNCQYWIHGDDPCICDGVNICEQLNSIGRFKEIRRTTGVSTTDLTGRLLDLLNYATNGEDEESKSGSSDESRRMANPPKQTFLQTSNRISNFSNRREPKPNDKIIYFQASCDLMHPGVIARLKAAKEQGDYLYVGLWDDEMIKYYRGAQYPLQGLQERVLMALAMKYVDDVVIGAPYIVTDDLIKSLNITQVVHVRSREDQVKPEYRSIDPFQVPKEQGIYVELGEVENDLTLEDIARRVEANKAQFEKKFKTRKAKQDDYYTNHKSRQSSLSSNSDINPEASSPAKVMDRQNSTQ